MFLSCSQAAVWLLSGDAVPTAPSGTVGRGGRGGAAPVHLPAPGGFHATPMCHSLAYAPSIWWMASGLRGWSWRGRCSGGFIRDSSILR